MQLTFFKVKESCCVPNFVIWLPEVLETICSFSFATMGCKDDRHLEYVPLVHASREWHVLKLTSHHGAYSRRIYDISSSFLKFVSFHFR
jgi:hypothetical protein